MKKTFNIIVLAVLFSLTSCTWTIPEKVSVSTKASFGFNMGNVEKDFDSFFDTDSFSNLSSNSPITMYDYFPGKQNEKIKKFLVKVPVQEIPIDFTSYFNDLQLSSMIRALSFDKKIKIPEISLNYNQSVTGVAIFAVRNAGTEEAQVTIPTISITNEINCTIETGSLTMEIVLPSSWSGVTVSYTPGISGSANLAPANSTPVVSGNKRIFTLDDAVFTAGAIDINTIVNFSGLTPSLDYSKNITVKIYSSITKIKEITASLEVDNVKVDNQQDISDDFKNKIKKIVLGKSGLKGTYINTLPADNDIKINVESNFIGIPTDTESPKTAILASNTSTQTAITTLYNGYSESNGFENTITSTSKVDFTVDIILPNSTSNSKSMTLKHVEPKKEYHIKIDLEPVLDWNSIELYSSDTRSYGNVDTGLNIGQVFGSITSSLGGDFATKCSIKSVPIKIYASKPNMTCFDDAEFNVTELEMYFSKDGGSTNAYPSSKIDFKPSTGIMPFADCPVLVTEGTTKKVVVTDISQYGASASGDMNALIEATKNETTGSIYMKYDIQLSTSYDSSEGGTFTITKADFNNSTNGSKAIQIMAYVVVPLEFNASDNVDIDIMGMMGINPGEDLLERTSPPDNSDKEKYFNAVRDMRVKYKADTIPFYCMPVNQNLYKNSTIFIDWDGTGTVYAERYLNMEKDELVIEDFQSILNMYPLTPDVKLRIPTGSFSIPRNAKMDLNVKLCIETDPDYKIFVMGEE